MRRFAFRSSSADVPSETAGLDAYGRSQRLLEIGSIALFVPLAAWGLWRFAAAAQLEALFIALIAVPLAWLLVDMLSGLAHWAFDTFGSIHTPILGSAFIRPFREHHADPLAITRHDFVETNGSSCFAAIPLLGVAGFVPLDDWSERLAQAVLLFTGLGILATNQCHKWAHMDEAVTPKVVRWAQRQWIILPRDHHRLHHTPPFDSHFCTSSGWFNATFNALLRAWR